MRSNQTPRLDDLFGPRRVDADYELPTPAEMAWRWRLERRNLMARAVWEEQFAFSHRGACYGIALLVCRPGSKDEDRFAIFSGPNFTLTRRPKHRLKMCGERISKGYADMLGYGTIVGVVIFSNNMQKDDVSKVFSDVQHPCWECREMFLPVLTPDSPMILFRNYGILPCEPLYPGSPEFVVQEPTFGESLRLHKHETG